jgi:predicted DCC family thiol-disulfide oxidoreductase YuxK
MKDEVVLYDSECGLCNRSVQFILKHERNQKLQFTSLQGSFSKKVISEINLKNDFNESILFYRDGKLFSKSKAVLSIIPFLRWYFYPILIFWLIPNFFRDLIYDLVAKNRNRYFQECKIVKSDSLSRYLD